MKTDDDLISAYLKGDGEAFARLYDRYAHRIHAFARSLGASSGVADDVVQQAWLQALDHLPRYRPRGRFRAWLFRITHRVWLDHLRTLARDGQPSSGNPHGKPTAQEFETMADGAPDPAARAAEDERAALVRAAIADLPDAVRETILLRLDGGLTYREIARAMGCPLGTALWRGREAERRLKRRLRALMDG